MTPNIEYIKTQIESIKGYKLVSTEYKNAHTKLKIQCDKNHIYDVTWNNWKKGYRCPICNIKISIEQVKKYIENEHNMLLSKEYKNILQNKIINCYLNKMK